MFYYGGKEYYPLEIEKIIGRDEAVVYDRNARGKAYFYIDLTTDDEELSSEAVKQ